MQAFLDNERYKDWPNIKINWFYYSDNNKINYENKPLTRRFPNPSIYKGENKHVKSIMRGNISYQKLKKQKFHIISLNLVHFQENLLEELISLNLLIMNMPL